MRWPLVAHLAGWLMILGLFLGLELGSPERPAFVYALRFAAAEALFGCAITSALWAIYRRTGVPGRAGALVAGVAAATVLGTVAWNLADRLTFAWLGLESEPRAILDPEVLAGESFDHTIILMAWHGAALSLQALRRSAASQRLAQEARLTALRYQINPHFLFNALSSAIAMTYEDVERARTMLTRLSGLLRDTLARDAATSTLGEELDVIERYVDIERLSFEEKLRVEIEASPAARACQVPPLLLHALVENAVKHGMRSSPMPLEISLRAAYDGKALRIEISNTGRLELGTEGLGLRNVRERLEALYASRHRFELAERDGRVRAILEIEAPEVGA